MSINDVDETLQEEKGVEIGQGSEQPISKPVGEELIYKKIGETLGLDSFAEMEKYKDDIKRIAEYARQQGCEDIMDFEWQVKQLDMKLPSPQLGEKRITNLSRYIYLLGEKAKVEVELDKSGGLNG